LGSDPFIDAQDWEIDSVDVAVRDTGANKATATVSFKSLGDRRTVVLALVKLKVGWRIADITWDRNGTLRGLLSKSRVALSPRLDLGLPDDFLVFSHLLANVARELVPARADRVESEGVEPRLRVRQRQQHGDFRLQLVGDFGRQVLGP